MPSSRPRLSPCTTSPSNRNGPPRNSAAALTSPAATRPRIWLDETVSPATSTSGTTRVSNSSCERRNSAVPCAPLPKRKFSPTETCVAPSRSISTSSTNSSADCSEKLAVERDHHQLVDAQARDQVALDRERAISLGAASGWITASGCGSKVSTVSRAADDLAVAEVDAVEGADRDLARLGPGLDVGELGDLHAGRTLRRAGARAARLARSRPAARPWVSRTSGPGARPPAGRAAPCPTAAASASRRAARSGRKASASRQRQRRLAGRRPRAGRAPIARALELARSRRRRDRRSACGRRCPPSTRSRSAARSPSCRAARRGGR